MKRGFFQLLRGTFLIDEGATKNWRFIVFLFVLALVMISASHGVDQKVIRMASLNDDVRALRSEYIELRKSLMKLKMESELRKKLSPMGLNFPSTPPTKISVIH